jgi:hypothetical protein
LLDPASFVHRELGSDLDFDYIAARLLVQGQVERATALAETISDPSTRALIRALVAQRNGQGEVARMELDAALRADASNDDARFARVRPELSALARGDATEETLALARPLASSAAAVVRGWSLALAGDFSALAALEDALATTRFTDPWFPEAARLRADWRIRVAGDARNARDAIRIIDRALVVRPDPELVMPRAEAAGVLRDGVAFAGAAHYAFQHIADELRAVETGTYILSSSDLELMRRRIAAWQEMLAGPGLDATSRESLARELERLARRAAQP